MQVLAYLNREGHSLTTLTEDFGIKVANNPKYPDLYVLNYCQINSPKTHIITQECRSLVVEFKDNKFSCVSRAFDRFFNLGEIEGEDFDLSTLSCSEKLDGSLVSVFFYEGEWLYRTKSMIMPDEEITINGFETSWKSFIEEALDWDNISDKDLKHYYTYLFEIVGKENRVVVRYNETKAYLLAARNNRISFYKRELPLHWDFPKTFNFSSTKDCVEAAKNLPDLQEGYVVYSSEGVPVCKIKSPAYVAAHRIRGEGLTPKRIRELVVMNEQSEYLSVFPEDEREFTAYVKAWEGLKVDIINTFSDVMNIVSQKDFALKVKDLLYSAVLFQTRNNKEGLSTTQVLSQQKDSYKTKLLEKWMFEQEQSEKVVIFTVGASASGKTTWAEKFVKDNPSYININRDDVRFDTFCDGQRDWTKYKFCKENENKVTSIIQDKIKEAISLEANVIISDTNLNLQRLASMKGLFEKEGYIVKEKIFDVDFETLIKRDSQRKGGVGYEVILNQHIQLKRNFLEVEHYTPKTSLPTAYIVDIDGTLAKMGKRSPFDWHLVGEDTLIKHVGELVTGLREQGHTILFFSGRDAVCTSETREWLVKHLGEWTRDSLLVLRDQGSYEKDYTVKMKMFDKYARNKYNVLAAIDDRKIVIEECWSVLGVNVINVGNPTKRF